MKKILLISLLVFTNLLSEEIYATFDVKAQRSANLAFTSSGTVENIHVDIGSLVKKGDKLAKLKNEDLHSTLNISEVTLKYAKIDLQRQTQIKNLIDQARYDGFQQKYESAKAQVRYQKALLDKTYVYAPFDGVIISKEIELGDVVSGEMVKTIFTIQSKSKRDLVLSFDQKYHGKVKVGDTFKYKIDGDNKEYVGTISKVYPSINVQKRSLTAEVKAQNIPAGLFGTGYIVTE